MMMYDNESRPIIDALNAAHNRGVQVRFITDIPGPNEAEDTVLVHLNPAIPFLAGNDESIMHNKVLIFDRDDVVRCQVMTGSTNHTIANLNVDYNNMVIIQDQ
jgi:phosphatidylserine/phosphatidylglycerophosphate/cardiolipin synthase-like enzyme